MNEEEKLERFETSFAQLCDDGKYHVIAIAQALLFAQKTINRDSNIERIDQEKK